jgi:hypothetical protein
LNDDFPLSIFIPILNVKGFTMNTAQAPFDLNLPSQALFSVDDAAGVQIVCRAGSVWITLDNDPRDIVLEADDSFTTPEHRRALIFALGDARVTLATAPEPVQQARRRPRPASRGLVLAQLPA